MTPATDAINSARAYRMRTSVCCTSSAMVSTAHTATAEVKTTAQL